MTHLTTSAILLDTVSANARTSAVMKPHPHHAFSRKGTVYAHRESMSRMGLLHFRGRNGRVSSGSEWIATERTPTRLHLAARRANCLRGIAIVVAPSGETNATMNRIAAAMEAWSKDGAGQVQPRWLGLSPLGEL